MKISRLLPAIVCLVVLAVGGVWAEDDVASQLRQLNNAAPNLRVAAMQQLAANPGGVYQHLSTAQGDTAIATDIESGMP